MSIIPKESIKVLAEIAGQSNVKEDILTAVASDAEYRLREVIQEAKKFMRHSKRAKLTTDDISSALKVKNIEPMYGFKSKDPIQFKKIAGTGGLDLYFIQDEEVDLNDVINAPLPKLPLEITFNTHWLAIDGVQPSTVQNAPHPDSKNRELEEKEREKSSKISEETIGATEGDPNVQVKPLVKHVLSKELQTYYQKILESIASNHVEVRKAAYNSLRADPGLHQLIPYFTQHISEKISQNLRNMDILWSSLKMAESLLENPNIFIEPYLHQLMPPILTCLVGKYLCANPLEDDHWSLRDFASRLVGHICKKYGDAYTTLQPRITKTLLRAFLDPLKPLTTHYGAIIGLGALGHEVVRALLIPNVKSYGVLLQEELNPEKNKDELKRLEAQKCHSALVKIVGEFIKSESSQSVGASSSDSDSKKLASILPTTKEGYEELFGMFGESLLPYVVSGQIVPQF